MRARRQRIEGTSAKYRNRGRYAATATSWLPPDQSASAVHSCLLTTEVTEVTETVVGLPNARSDRRHRDA